MAKPYKSEGLEEIHKSITNRYVVPGRELVKRQFLKKRSTFGQELNLQDKDTDGFVQISNTRNLPSVVAKSTNSISLQAARPKTSMAAQTTYRKQVNQGIQV